MLRTQVIAYIALGANLGDAKATVLRAMDDIAKLPDTQVAQHSSLYRTAPVDSSGPDYINAVVQIVTTLPAPLLLEQLQKLEQQAGRQRPFANAPRTLDLDILLYGSASIHSASLSIPHPRMEQRAFVLMPLQEIAPSLVTAQQLAAVAHQICTVLK
jgi:2-amino-4-hydroxy-6-hydroxymethyldihydropteridine diphosphokinase